MARRDPPSAVIRPMPVTATRRPFTTSASRTANDAAPCGSSRASPARRDCAQLAAFLDHGDEHRRELGRQRAADQPHPNARQAFRLVAAEPDERGPRYALITP
jgi:hypothetical protein